MIQISLFFFLSINLHKQAYTNEIKPPIYKLETISTHISQKIAMQYRYYND